MEKIDAFTITGLSVEGFKCFNKKQHFDLGGMTTITGHNGQGKSSIAEAIAYAITGNYYFGGEQSLDRLYALETGEKPSSGKNATVELTIKTGDGAAHTLTRNRKNDSTTVTYDGVTVRQSDLSAMFGEKDVFLSIFNPLYFIEVLGDKGRNLLERYLPVIPHEDVLERMSESSRALLESQKMKSPEALLETVREDVRNLENTVIYIEGQRDILESQARERREAEKGKRAEIAELDASIADLKARRAEGVDFDAMQLKLDGLYKRFNDLSYAASPHPDTTEIDAKICEAMASLEKRRAEKYESQYTAQIAETEAVIAQLRKNFSKETSILNGLEPGIRCPVCKQDVTVQNIDAVKKAFTESIAKIQAEGNASTKKLNELKEFDESTKAVFEEFRNDDVDKLESELENLNMQRLEIISGAGDNAPDKSAELDALKGDIQALEVDLRFGKLSPPDGWTLESYIKERAELESELAQLVDSQAAGGAEEKADDIDSIRKSVKDKRGIEEAIKSYISERTRLMIEGFGSLSKVDIVLFEAVKKTGVVKDVFKFSYDGRPYKYLSLSEKIKAGLEISELIKRLAGRNYPVFIDNSESVPVIDNVRPTGQVIVAQVAKGAALKVEALAMPADVKKAA